MNLEEIKSLAVSAAMSAGSVIMGYYGDGFETWSKGNDNPVTSADLKADQTLRQQLLSTTPGYGWLSEETADRPDRLAREKVWIVDPLDGTKEFIDRIDEFAVSIGLAEQGRAVLGVVHNPVTGEIVAGATGSGTTCNGAPCPPMSNKAAASGACVLASNTETRRGIWKPYKDVFDIREMGSAAYKLACLASGRGDAYISLNPKNEWDICAGVFLVQAAGGMVTDLDGNPFQFNREWVKVNGLIAANPRLHARLLEIISHKPG